LHLEVEDVVRGRRFLPETSIFAAGEVEVSGGGLAPGGGGRGTRAEMTAWRD
jgi:hypothetical protein